MVMGRSRPSLDVCLLAEGIGPRTIGGVSRWAASLAAELPHRSFAMAGPHDELPPARIYHALTPLAAATAGPAVRAAGRPLLLTCHAMSDTWRPEGVRWTGVDASQGGGHGGGGGNDDGDGDHGDGDHGDHRDNNRAVARLERRGYGEATLIAAVSGAVAESHVAAGAPAGRTIVIPNGAAFGPISRRVEQPLVGFVGRLAPIKGLERLLRAMRAVRATRPDARLVLVGPADGPAGYVQRLQRLAEQPGLRGAVYFAGEDRPERWYPRLACLAMASETEGMPLALLEAMAHGVPCVAPDVGGIREALSDAGVIVAPRSEDGLAEGILRILDDADEAYRLSCAGRARAARWTAADTAAAYDALYALQGLPCRTFSS
jgi:glycosyltransferase involved in cell wall biosynthesis